MSPRGGGPRPLVLVLVAVAGVALGSALARRFLDAVEVVGDSMAPQLRPGDRLIVESATYARRSPRVGEIVLAADPRRLERELIKRVALVDPAAATVDLRGDAPEASTDSRAFGAVPLESVRWRVAFRYWPADRVGPA
ncbi:MAG: nickel-type superoxide dismutase maturation protease [Candidatus Limnocylindria bacterium]